MEINIKRQSPRVVVVVLCRNRRLSEFNTNDLWLCTVQVLNGTGT